MSPWCIAVVWKQRQNIWEFLHCTHGQAVIYNTKLCSCVSHEINALMLLKIIRFCGIFLKICTQKFNWNFYNFTVSKAASFLESSVLSDLKWEYFTDHCTVHNWCQIFDVGIFDIITAITVIILVLVNL